MKKGLLIFTVVFFLCMGGNFVSRENSKKKNRPENVPPVLPAPVDPRKKDPPYVPFRNPGPPIVPAPPRK